MQNQLILKIGSKNYLFTHGHKINENTPLNYDVNAVVFGHFHVQKDIIKNGVEYISPGSISLPKNDSFHGFLEIDNNGFKIKNLIK